jgi:hypothetical protein
MTKPSAQLLIAFAIIGLFAAAFFSSPSDEMMRGALIAAFSTATGYFLGSSTGSKSSGDVIRRIAEQPNVTATGANPTINTPGPVETAAVAPEETPPWERGA